MNKQKNVLAVIVAGMMIFSGFITMNSCVHQPGVVPTSTTGGASPSHVCFERDILPIFQSNCAKSGCHDASSREDGYVLDSYNNIIKKGIVPGNPSGSKIYKSLIASGEDQMPRNASPLAAASIALIRQWISEGAVDSGSCYSSCDTNNFTYGGAIAPLMQTYCTGCHSSVSAPGGSLVDYNSVKNAAVNGNLIGAISHATGYTPMPKNGTQLLDCQVTQVKKWVAAGALNN